MQDFVSFLAPAKVNLFLHITGRREDGYHLLQSIFSLISLYDTVHLKVRNDGRIVRYKPIANVSEQQDLCLCAAHLLQQHTACNLGVEIAVDKRIPMGGGLGGGSSDAATVLIALNHLWGLNLSRAQLMALGLKLGADVPFFIFGQNAWVEGIGEKIQAISIPASHYVIATPHTHVSTAEIFSSKELTRNTIPTTIAAFHETCSEKQSRGTEKKAVEQFHNDLAPVVFKQYPVVAACVNWLNQQGAEGISLAKMSGSGASVFVECKTEALAQQIKIKVPELIAGVPVFAYVAHGLSQHPLYNLIVS